MNTVTLIGRLTRDPERREGEVELARMRLAVPRASRAEEAVDFITVVCFGRQAENSATYLRKGRLIGVSGWLSQSEWTTDTGDRRERVEVIADRVDYLDSPAPGPERC